jgi:hypothetical protein
MLQVLSDDGSPKKQKVDRSASKQDKKYGGLESSGRKGTARERHKNSRYTSDPCRDKKDEEQQPLNEMAAPIQPPPPRPTSKQPAANVLPVDEDDYLKPQSAQPSYMDLVEDNDTVPVTASNPEYFDDANETKNSAGDKGNYYNSDVGRLKTSTHAPRAFTESQV